MRRVVLAVLICLISLQSFAGELMHVKMAGTSISMDMMTETASTSHHDSVQMPCHDCCGSPMTCQNLSQVFVVPAASIGLPEFVLVNITPSTFTASFQSADLALGFKPPLF
jgi:hypothetical protein